MEQAAPAARTCPQCVQPLAAGVEACAKCGRDEANPFAPSAAPIERLPAAEGDPRLYGAILAAIALSMIAAFFVSGVSVLFGAYLVFAAFRAAEIVKRREEAESSTTRRIGFFQALLTTAGVMALVWLATAITFTMICFPLGFILFNYQSGHHPGGGLLIWIILGFVVGMMVLNWLTLRFWPRAAKN